MRMMQFLITDLVHLYIFVFSSEINKYGGAKVTAHIILSNYEKQIYYFIWPYWEIKVMADLRANEGSGF